MALGQHLYVSLMELISQRRRQRRKDQNNLSSPPFFYNNIEHINEIVHM